jgi:hypothetical protein
MEQIPGKSRGNRLETRECGATQREISRIPTNNETDLKNLADSATLICILMTSHNVTGTFYFECFVVIRRIGRIFKSSF